MSVKAIIFAGADRPLVVGEAPRRNLASDEVRLDIAACGICGSDLHMAHAPETFGITEGSVLGHEFAGTIRELGSEVTEFAVGDRVAVAPLRGCGDCPSCRAGQPAWCAQMALQGGGYAESTVAAARQCRFVPSGVALEDAALAEPTAVALHAVMRRPLRPGARVLVLGAGPIGLLVAFWARRLGAAEVVVADIAPHQKDRALAMGATRFELSDDALAARLEQDGGLPEVVYECVGRKGLIDRAVALVATQGTVVGVGLCVERDSFDGFAALHKEATITMSAFFDMAEFEMALDALSTETGPRPQLLVTDRVPLDATPDAFAALYAKTTACKTMVCPGVASSS
ncbi:Zn-dependent alcohol dehydrogenase [Mesobaculum littorinae]|uniref:Zn-dependent alcohol dehydrogenase n=1 Tax=Mesobaculum littorinae TaxID=2486419 RepID=A0A438AG77_9RHOB|nr:alcohol dehydrogenase catalytic domain-containing protein [Mesobaculum littorinae]RVV97723.1 Zn-dependent alcohol dehydrogenase [Mesobaculum littorinae]